MDSILISDTARASLAGTNSFPEAVKSFLAAGVEYYHVDYVGRRKTFYGPAGDAIIVPIDYENLPPVASEFSAQALQAAIRDSQHSGQKYREFTRRAVLAGVQGYYAFLRGQRVTYWGRQGDQHIEWFPGAGPKK
jgi:uncharacterized protein YbcV (DUF1398 family)